MTLFPGNTTDSTTVLGQVDKLRGYGLSEVVLRATREELDKVARMVAAGKLLGKARIGVRVGKTVNKYLIAKHVVLNIEDAVFSYALNEESIRAEAALDGATSSAPISPRTASPTKIRCARTARCPLPMSRRQPTGEQGIRRQPSNALEPPWTAA